MMIMKYRSYRPMFPRLASVGEGGDGVEDEDDQHFNLYFSRVACLLGQCFVVVVEQTWVV